jgi:hypothetical protein
MEPFAAGSCAFTGEAHATARDHDAGDTDTSSYSSILSRLTTVLPALRPTMIDTGRTQNTRNPVSSPAHTDVQL